MHPLKLDKLEDLPKHREEYLWADFFELLCLTHPDSEISKAALVDRINERRPLGELTPVEEDAGQDSYYDFDSLEESRTMPGTVDERTERWVADIFAHLQYRHGALKNHYAFDFSPKGNSLRLKSALTNETLLYIYLLLAGNQYALTQQAKTMTTDLFEIVSRISLQMYLSDRAKVYVFGANSYDSDQRYKGLLKDKIDLLAKDFKEQTSYEDKDFKKGNSGDGGLDLVGWLPFGADEGWGSVRVMGQCACGTEWEQKQHSSSAPAWSNKIAWRIRPINMIFIPRCFRMANGTWHQNEPIQESVLVDRMRIMQLVVPNISQLPVEVLQIARAAKSQTMPDV